jgi:hypothetical protein
LNNIKWVDPHQPQTLQMATILMYVEAALIVLQGGIFGPFGLLLTVGYVGGALGIANEKRYGYAVALGVAVLVALLHFAGGIGPIFDNLNLLISTAISIALVALLAHPQSREYQKIWFR